MQVSAGQKSGSEEAVHAISTEDTDALLLIVVTNAFNMLKRAAALHNI